MDGILSSTYGYPGKIRPNGFASFMQNLHTAHSPPVHKSWTVRRSLKWPQRAQGDALECRRGRLVSLQGLVLCQGCRLSFSKMEIAITIQWGYCKGKGNSTCEGALWPLKSCRWRGIICQSCLSFLGKARRLLSLSSLCFEQSEVTVCGLCPFVPGPG